MITRELAEIEGRSSAMRSEEAVLSFARGLFDAGVEVLRIKGETELSGEDIAGHCAGDLRDVARAPDPDPRDVGSRRGSTLIARQHHEGRTDADEDDQRRDLPIHPGVNRRRKFCAPDHKPAWPLKTLPRSSIDQPFAQKR